MEGRLKFDRNVFLLNLILKEAPPQVRHLSRVNFALLACVALRQRQLTKAKLCHSEKCGFDAYLSGIEDVDIDRAAWLPRPVLDKFLLRAGQWVRLCKFEDRDGAEFICQVVPLPENDKQHSRGNLAVWFNYVTEYNLRRALRIPQFQSLPPLQIKPLLTDPVIRTPSKSLPFSPIQGKRVKLTRLAQGDLEISAQQCDLVIQSLFDSSPCKFLCVGDLISVPLSRSTSLNLIVSEVNDSRLMSGDGGGCREIFKVTKDSSSVYLNSNEIHNQLHPKIDKHTEQVLLPPCLEESYDKLCLKMGQVLSSNHFSRNSSKSELWPNFLVYGPVGSGKHTICRLAALRFGLNFQFLNATNFIGDTSAFTEAMFRATLEKLKSSFCPALVFIRNVHLVGKDKEGNADKRVVIAFQEFLQDIASYATSLSCTADSDIMTSRCIFVVGCTDSPDDLLPSIGHAFPLKLELPASVSSVGDTESTLEWFLRNANVGLETGFDIGSWVRSNCAGMRRSYGDLKAFVSTSIRNAWIRDSTASSLELNADDFHKALKSIDAVLKKAASTVEVPNVIWEDVGGMEDVKKELISSIRLPLEFPHLFASSIRRSGILLYGPPGTGKTLIAKAVANEFKLSFLSVKGPELLNMYVGQSEKNVRDVFTRARNASPCIVFFDELDALAPNRGRAGDSGGVMDRVVSQILAELDGTHSTPGVFVIGATNRPDLIDPALLRPGRFDKLLYVGINEDVTTKAKVLGALTRKFQLADDVNLTQMASALPKGMSGADLYSLCSDAYMTAVERNIASVSSKLPDSETVDPHWKVLVTFGDFESALTRVTTSLSETEQAKYETLKDMTR